MEKRILIILLIMVMLLGISGCGKKEDEFTGKWKSEELKMDILQVWNFLVMEVVF